MEFILLMDRMKCLLNTVLQVLTVAPALHSLMIWQREDAANIMEFLNHKHVDLRKLVLQYCWLGEDNTDLLANIVDLYPDLEGLSLECSRSLRYSGYCLISRLKKLSELNLSYCEVFYVYVKPLETRISIREHVGEHRYECIYIFRQKGNLLNF